MLRCLSQAKKCAALHGDVRECLGVPDTNCRHEFKDRSRDIRFEGFIVDLRLCNCIVVDLLECLHEPERSFLNLYRASPLRELSPPPLINSHGAGLLPPQLQGHVHLPRCSQSPAPILYPPVHRPTSNRSYKCNPTRRTQSPSYFLKSKFLIGTRFILGSRL